MVEVLKSRTSVGVFPFASEHIDPIGAFGGDGFEKAVIIEKSSKRTIIELFNQPPGVRWSLNLDGILGVSLGLTSGGRKKEGPDSRPYWERLFVQTGHGWIRLMRMAPADGYAKLQEKFPILLEDVKAAI